MTNMILNEFKSGLIVLDMEYRHVQMFCRNRPRTFNLRHIKLFYTVTVTQSSKPKCNAVWP